MQQSIVRVFFDTAAKHSTREALREKIDGQWVSTTWEKYATQVRRAARGLIALGVEPADEICIVGWNSSEWLICNSAVMATG